MFTVLEDGSNLKYARYASYFFLLAMYGCLPLSLIRLSQHFSDASEKLCRLPNHPGARRQREMGALGGLKITVDSRWE